MSWTHLEKVRLLTGDKMTQHNEQREARKLNHKKNQVEELITS
jgi:hypothetical protein